MSFSGGADAHNIPHLLEPACAQSPSVRTCSDRAAISGSDSIWKPRNAMDAAGTSNVENSSERVSRFGRYRSGNEQPRRYP